MKSVECQKINYFNSFRTTIYIGRSPRGHTIDEVAPFITGPKMCNSIHMKSFYCLTHCKPTIVHK